MSMAIYRSSTMRHRHVRPINAANSSRRRKQGSGSAETEFGKGDGDDYVAAEDRMSMFCSVKYNSMNCFTLRFVCQQNKGRMVRLPFVGGQDFHRSFP
ncbi:hypothetical protein ACWGS9_06615 [Bradyrhizobium sp. Arg314]